MTEAYAIRKDYYKQRYEQKKEEIKKRQAERYHEKKVKEFSEKQPALFTFCEKDLVNAKVKNYDQKKCEINEKSKQLQIVKDCEINCEIESFSQKIVKKFNVKDFLLSILLIYLVIAITFFLLNESVLFYLKNDTNELALIRFLGLKNNAEATLYAFLKAHIGELLLVVIPALRFRQRAFRAASAAVSGLLFVYVLTSISLGILDRSKREMIELSNSFSSKTAEIALIQEQIDSIKSDVNKAELVLLETDPKKYITRYKQGLNELKELKVKLYAKQDNLTNTQKRQKTNDAQEIAVLSKNIEFKSYAVISFRFILMISSVLCVRFLSELIAQKTMEESF